MGRKPFHEKQKRFLHSHSGDCSGGQSTIPTHLLTSFPNFLTVSMSCGRKTASNRLFSPSLFAKQPAQSCTHGRYLEHPRHGIVCFDTAHAQKPNRSGRGHSTMASTKRRCLSLRPIPAAIQRVAVYETRTVSPISTLGLLNSGRISTNHCREVILFSEYKKVNC